MKNINELLKRQLLLMKYDTGVTLNENDNIPYVTFIPGRGVGTPDTVVIDKILDGCDTRDNSKGTLVNQSTHKRIADLYQKSLTNWPNPDVAKFKEATEYVKKYFSYSDLCNVKNLFIGTFKDELDYYSSGISEFNPLIPFQTAVSRGCPNCYDSISSGMTYTFNFFKKTFPCVFAQNRVNIDKVFHNGKYDYILLNAPTNDVIQMYFDGFLREQRTLADVTYYGKPAKLFCEGNKIKISSRD
jgi:hypothetical protein